MACITTKIKSQDDDVSVYLKVVFHCSYYMIRVLQIFLFCNMFVLSRGDEEDEDFFFVDDQDVNRLIKLSHVLDFFLLYFNMVPLISLLAVITNNALDLASILFS